MMRAALIDAAVGFALAVAALSAWAGSFLIWPTSVLP